MRTYMLLMLLACVLDECNLLRMKQKKRGQKYCGSQIDNILRFTCDGKYNSMFTKKSITEPLTVKDYLESMLPLRGKADSLGLVGSRRYRRWMTGIHDECCRKTCELKEIKAYCAE